ncbi:MAG: erythromycin esterase [Candidatus Dormibacteraeota bacterium]|nr:erythromycin esterase [Candidatus Dormibacteraeota bacterium]
MTEEEIIRFMTSLPNVEAMTAREGDGSPEVAWGDSFFFVRLAHEPPSDQRWPFATVVVKDYPGWDTASDLDREGRFRLNISVGRQAFEELFGYAPSAHAQHQEEFDYTAVDRLIPHPVYATQAWAAVINPGDASDERVRTLLVEAHAREVRRHLARD